MAECQTVVFNGYSDRQQTIQIEAVPIRVYSHLIVLIETRVRLDQLPLGGLVFPGVDDRPKVAGLHVQAPFAARRRIHHCSPSLGVLRSPYRSRYRPSSSKWLT